MYMYIVYIDVCNALLEMYQRYICLYHIEDLFYEDFLGYTFSVHILLRWYGSKFHIHLCLIEFQNPRHNLLPTHTYTHQSTRTNLHTPTHIHTKTHQSTRTNLHTPTYIHTKTHQSTRTNLHTPTLTHLHSHTYTHTPTLTHLHSNTPTHTHRQWTPNDQMKNQSIALKTKKRPRIPLLLNDFSSP